MNFVTLDDKSIRGYTQNGEIFINLSSISFPDHLSGDYFFEHITSEIQKIEFHELGHFYYHGPLDICKHDYSITPDDVFLQKLGYGNIHCPWCSLTQWYLGNQSHNIGAYTGGDCDEFERRQKLKLNKLREAWEFKPL